MGDRTADQIILFHIHLRKVPVLFPCSLYYRFGFQATMKKIFSVSNLTIGGEQTYIALPLTGKTAEELCEGARKASETTAEIIEIRADFYEEIRNRGALTQVLKRIRSALPNRCLLFTLRTKGEGGALKVTDEEYRKLAGEAV